MQASEMITQTGSEALDTIGAGTFTSYQHSLAGKAMLYTDVMNKKVIALQEFSMTAGPDVHVFLSKTASYSPSNVLDVATLNTGYINSNLYYTINGYDPSYRYVLVYCITYSALFGYTELN